MYEEGDLTWDPEEFSSVPSNLYEDSRFDQFVSTLDIQPEQQNDPLYDDLNAQSYYNYFTPNPDPQQQLHINPFFLRNDSYIIPTSSNQEVVNTTELPSFVSFETLMSENPQLSDISDDAPPLPFSSLSSSSSSKNKRSSRETAPDAVILRRHVKHIPKSQIGSVSSVHLMGILGKINNNDSFFADVVLTPDTNVPFKTAVSYLFDNPSNNFPIFEGFSEMDAMFGDHGIPLNAKYKIEEQFIQFSEFEDREFSILGRTDKEKLQRFIPSPRRGVRINTTTLIDLLHETPNEVLVIDARFDYEYQGGTIGGYVSNQNSNNFGDSINIDEYWNFAKIFNALWVENNQFIVPRYPGKTLVIFCEFSSMRGPGLYRNVTLLDHLISVINTKEPSAPAAISYPNIYILQGGFHDFFEYAKKNNAWLQQEQKMFVVDKSRSLSSYSFSSQVIDLYVSEIAQSSDSIWRRKKTYMERKKYIDDLEKTMNFTAARFSIFKSFVDLCDPLKMSHDSFETFKQHLMAENLLFLKARRAIVPLEENDLEPFAQRQRLGIHV